MMTNREWLNSITNEDLVRWLYDDYFSFTETISEVLGNSSNGRQTLLEWLKKPHSDAKRQIEEGEDNEINK